MKRRANTYAVLIGIVLLLAGCDEQRDLYVTANPLIYVEGDWMPSRGEDDMSMNATAVAYGSGGQQIKEYFFDPNNVTIPVTKGTYDVMIFNGLMYSPEETHLDNVFFRGTDRIDTFEAVVREAAPNRRLGRAEGEYIASNEMEIVTSAVQRQEITSEQGYYLKYKDGKNGFPIPDDYVEAELYMTPVPVSYESRIVLTIDNISSAYTAHAALYGFVGSVFMQERLPSHFYVTHQFTLNNKRMIPGYEDRGTIETPTFVTFGPPVDAPDKTYQVYIRITLVNNTVFEETVDITEQVQQVIEAIRENIGGAGDMEYQLTIPLDLTLELPKVDPVEGGIGVGDWEEDEIIRVPITW